MSKFKVDTQTLNAAATHLDTIRTDLHSLAKLPKSDDNSFGGKQVVTWFEQFESAWTYGVTQIDSSVDGLATGLRQAAKNYHDGEATITAAATHGKGSGTSGHNGGGTTGGTTGGNTGGNSGGSGAAFKGGPLKSAKGLSVKGIAMTAAQLAYANQIISIGKSLGASPNAISTVMTQAIAESNLGESDALGWDSENPRYGGLLAGNVDTFGHLGGPGSEAVTKAEIESAFKGGNGYQGGGAIALAKQGVSPGRAAEICSGSGDQYEHENVSLDEMSSEAEKIVAKAN